MVLHPEVRAFPDIRRQTDPGIDYGRIGAAQLRAGFAIQASPASPGAESLRIEGRRIPPVRETPKRACMYRRLPNLGRSWCSSTAAASASATWRQLTAFAAVWPFIRAAPLFRWTIG